MEADRLPLISITARDDSASVSVMRFNVVAGTSRAAARGAANNLRSALSGITDCALVEQRIVYSRVDLSPAAAAPGAQATFCGVFIFETTEPNQYGILAVPGFRPDLCVIGAEGEGVRIDLGAPAVAALVQQLVSGLWRNPWGHALTRCAAAFVQIRP